MSKPLSYPCFMRVVSETGQQIGQKIIKDELHLPIVERWRDRILALHSRSKTLQVQFVPVGERVKRVAQQILRGDKVIVTFSLEVPKEYAPANRAEQTRMIHEATRKNPGPEPLLDRLIRARTTE